MKYKFKYTCNICHKETTSLYNWCCQCNRVVTLKCDIHWSNVKSICDSCKKLLYKCNKHGAIYYKQDMRRAKAILKPNTFYWRLRYWINKYLSMFTNWVTYPIAKWNYSFWNIREGEETFTLCQIQSIGMIIETSPNVFKFKVPFWVNKNKSVSYFKEIIKDLKCSKKF